MADVEFDTSYWSQAASALAAALGSGGGGLTSACATKQLAIIGPNSVEDAPRLSALRLLLRQFENPLVLILAFAAAISLVLLQWLDAGIILAIVTGESFPVEKRPGIIAADAPIAARTNAVFLGASVRSGRAKVLAVRTGRRTEFGAIAARLWARPSETDFARGVRHFGHPLIRVMHFNGWRRFVLVLLPNCVPA